MDTIGEYVPSRTSNFAGDNAEMKTHDSMDVDSSGSEDGKIWCAIDSMFVPRSLFKATRTLPISTNKYKKRVGAKTAKKLDVRTF